MFSGDSPTVGLVPRTAACISAQGGPPHHHLELAVEVPRYLRPLGAEIPELGGIGGQVVEDLGALRLAGLDQLERAPAEDDALGGEGVEVGRCLPRRAVDPQGVGPQGVEAHHDHVLPWLRGKAPPQPLELRELGPAAGERQAESTGGDHPAEADRSPATSKQESEQLDSSEGTHPQELLFGHGGQGTGTGAGVSNRGSGLRPAECHAPFTKERGLSAGEDYQFVRGARQVAPSIAQ